MRKFSLAYLTIPGTNPMDQIRIAKECGYDSVSLRTISMHLPVNRNSCLIRIPRFLPQQGPRSKNMICR